MRGGIIIFYFLNSFCPAQSLIKLNRDWRQWIVMHSSARAEWNWWIVKKPTKIPVNECDDDERQTANDKMHIVTELQIQIPNTEIQHEETKRNEMNRKHINFLLLWLFMPLFRGFSLSLVCGFSCAYFPSYFSCTSTLLNCDSDYIIIRIRLVWCICSRLQTYFSIKIIICSVF